MKVVNTEARVETSVLCNANCIICPRDQFKKRLGVMPMWMFKPLLPQFKELGIETVSLFGYGEPLCDPGLDQKVKLCTDMGFDTFLTTNAGMLNKDVSQRLIEAGLTHIRFSVHGLGDNQEKVQVGLNFVKVMDNIIRFVNLSKGRVMTSVTAICRIVTGKP